MNLKLYKGVLSLAVASTVLLSKPVDTKAITLPVTDEADEIHIIEARMDMPVRTEPRISGDEIGWMHEGEKLEKIGDEGNYYKVLFCNQEGYVPKECSNQIIELFMPNDCKKTVYIKSKSAPIYESLDSENAFDRLDNLEVCEVLDIIDDQYYYVRVNDIYGFIEASQCGELTDTFVVVDISDQHLKLYKNNRVVLESDVITGKPGSDTNLGKQEIIQIRRDTNLIGPDWNIPVTVYARFNNNCEGFHDATWRDEEAFGGNTYLTNGSHGCVNMPFLNAVNLVDRLSLGDDVIIKR